MRFSYAGILITALLSVVACHDEPASKADSPPEASTAPKAIPVPKAVPIDRDGQPLTATGEGHSGQHRKGEHEQDEGEWIPGEYKTGVSRFKDAIVYVDGAPKGMLSFGELPLPIKVAWHDEESAIAFGPDHPGPHFKITKQRRYRVADYMKAIGVNPAKIKAIHIYGGGKRRLAAAVITGRELAKHKDFAFRFGNDIGGKPIPVCPESGWHCPDNITAIAVYVTKAPPVQKDGINYLNGEPG